MFLDSLIKPNHAPGTLGKAQLDWLIASLASSTTRWQLVGNPVMMAPFMFPPFDTATVGAIAEMLGLPK